MCVSARSTPLSIFSCLALVIVALAPRLGAQTTVTTTPVGYVQTSCTAATDTVVSVPFQQAATFVGTVASVSGSSVTVSNSTSWTTNQYVYSGSGTSTYYALFGDNAGSTEPNDGRYYTITSNGSNSFTVALNGDSISTVPTGTTVSIIAYWTLGTVFPPSMSGSSFVATTSPFFPQTELFVPSYSGTGINLAASATYFFYGGQWCLSGSSTSISFNDKILIPDGYVIQRNPAGFSTTLTAMGTVNMGTQTIPLTSYATTSQDNFVAIQRPVPTTLNNLGLITSGAFTPTTSLFFPQDELFVSGTGTGENQAASATYVYYEATSGTGWLLVGGSTSYDYGDNVTIQPGTGFIIRKVATGGGATAFWQNTPSY